MPRRVTNKTTQSIIMVVTEEVCFVCCDVTGIKFYGGLRELNALIHVRLCRETNPKDDCAIQDLEKNLGHVERRVAALLAPIMDAELAGLVLKA